MKVDIRSPDLDKMVLQQIEAAERGMTRAMRQAAEDIKQAWRSEIRSAGLGDRRANTGRAAAYPERGESLEAAALIWTKAPKIIAAHDRGALIRSRSGFWLAIPLPAAGLSRRRGRITPAEWESRTGRRLRFVYRRGRTALLVADDARIGGRGRAVGKGGRRRKDGILTGAQTVPIFVLVPQVRLKRRLDLVPPCHQRRPGLVDRRHARQFGAGLRHRLQKQQAAVQIGGIVRVCPVAWCAAQVQRHRP